MELEGHGAVGLDVDRGNPHCPPPLSNKIEVERYECSFFQIQEPTSSRSFSGALTKLSQGFKSPAFAWETERGTSPGIFVYKEINR